MPCWGDRQPARIQSRWDQRKAAEAIQEASDGLLSILNDILDLSKLDTGKLEFEQVPFSIESVIDNTKSIVALRAVEKG